jgi:hypothetical protein
MLFESIWATRLTDAVVSAGGNVVLTGRIPHLVIEQAIVARTGTHA